MLLLLHGNICWASVLGEKVLPQFCTMCANLVSTHKRNADGNNGASNHCSNHNDRNDPRLQTTRGGCAQCQSARASSPPCSADARRGA